MSFGERLRKIKDAVSAAVPGKEDLPSKKKIITGAVAGVALATTLVNLPQDGSAPEKPRVSDKDAKRPEAKGKSPDTKQAEALQAAQRELAAARTELAKVRSQLGVKTEEVSRLTAEAERLRAQNETLQKGKMDEAVAAQLRDLEVKLRDKTREYDTEKARADRLDARVRELEKTKRPPAPKENERKEPLKPPRRYDDSNWSDWSAPKPKN